MPRIHNVNANGPTPNLPKYFTRIPPVCELEIPEWPFPEGATDTQKFFWKKLWKQGVAHLWHRSQCYDAVARYCIQLSRIALGLDLGAACHAECRQSEDKLGLTPKAQYQLFIVIDDGVDEVEPATDIPKHKKEKGRNRPDQFTG